MNKTIKQMCLILQNRGRSLDMNVIPVWKKGYTGKGIVVTILDDGIEKNHPDLKRNYVRTLAYFFPTLFCLVRSYPALPYPAIPWHHVDRSFVEEENDPGIHISIKAVIVQF